MSALCVLVWSSGVHPKAEGIYRGEVHDGQQLIDVTLGFFTGDGELAVGELHDEVGMFDVDVDDLSRQRLLDPMGII